jgi:hypothetical protein
MVAKETRARIEEGCVSVGRYGEIGDLPQVGAYSFNMILM